MERSSGGERGPESASARCVRYCWTWRLGVLVYVLRPLQVRRVLTVGHADDHFFDVITSRLCNFQPLPCNAQGNCVTAADAAKVFDIGA